MTIKIIQIVVIFLNLSLGVFVLSQNIKSFNNRIFSLMSFIAALWTFTNYMVDVSASLIWLQSSYALGALVISTGLIWTLSITETNLKKERYVPIILIALFFCSGSYLPSFIIKSYHETYPGTIIFEDPGWGLILYTIFYMIVAFLIIWKLYKAKINAVGKETKKQFRNIYYGALITLVVTLFSSFIFPLFSIFPFGGIDNAGFLIFLIFIAYSISKHHLFNIKVIAVQLTVFTLWIFILIRVILSKNLHNFLIEGILFIIALVLGILLIQAVLQGIKQRMEIEKLTENLKKAYTHMEENTLL